MPVTDHLNWHEVPDFKAGLWDRTGIIMPAEAFTAMNDCYPNEAGGLRPMFVSTDVGVSGLAAASTEVCTGLFVIAGYSRRTGGSSENGRVHYMSTWDEASGRSRLYRMDGTAGATTWTALKTTATTADNPADRYQSQFARYQTDDDKDLLIWANNAGPSGERGIYSVEYSTGGSDGTVTQLKTGNREVIAVNQGRLITIGSGNGVLGRDTLYWTDEGSVTFPAANFQTPQPNVARRNIRLIGTQDPAELLIGFAGAPWVVISGDINSLSTPVRSMGHQHVPGGAPQQMVKSEEGNLFIEDQGTIFATDGRSFQNISPQLAVFASDWGVTTFSAQGIPTAGFQGPGKGDAQRGWLFMPGGYVRFAEGGGWAKISAYNIAYVSSDIQDGVFFATKGTGFSVRRLIIRENAGTRGPTYNFTTAPIAGQDGRRIGIKEVQLYGEVKAETDFVVTLLGPSGSTIRSKTVSDVPLKKQMIRFQFPTTQDEYLQVKVAVDAGAGVAPDLEKLRIGFIPEAKLGA